MAAINGAQIAGAGRIIAIDTNPAKLQLATKLGATDIINPADGDVVKQVRDLTNGGVQHSFEVLGRKETAEQAFAMEQGGGKFNRSNSGALQPLLAGWAKARSAVPTSCFQ